MALRGGAGKDREGEGEVSREVVGEEGEREGEVAEGGVAEVMEEELSGLVARVRQEEVLAKPGGEEKVDWIEEGSSTTRRVRG